MLYTIDIIIMKKIRLIAACFFLTGVLHGQTCSHTNLSQHFTFITKATRFQRGNDLDSCSITIAVVDKQSKKMVQSIQYSSVFLYNSTFRKCDFVRSFTTGKNVNVEPLDNNYGDLVIADFNFDGREDFAVIRDAGVSTGPLYSFYVQITKGVFKYDKYLSETVVYFPSNINPKQKTLTTNALAGAIGVYRRVYVLDKSKKWRLLSKKLITG
jgi:hypothetical protein